MPLLAGSLHMAACQDLVPLVNIKIAGKWMFIPLKMVLIGIDPYPNISQAAIFACPVSASEDLPEETWADSPPMECQSPTWRSGRNRCTTRGSRGSLGRNDPRHRGQQPRPTQRISNSSANSQAKSPKRSQANNHQNSIWRVQSFSNLFSPFGKPLEISKCLPSP